MRAYRFIKVLPLCVAVFLSCKPATSPVNQASEDQGGAYPPDSVKILYVGTYNEGEDTAGGQAPGILIFRMDQRSGKLTRVGGSPHIINPSYLVISANGQRLYAVNETGNESSPSGMISAFRLTSKGTQMEFINSVPSQGNYPCYVTLDRTGRMALCANYGSGTVAAFPVMNDGSVGKASSTIQHTGKGPHPNQKAAHAHLIIQSPHNQFVYACDLGTDNIFIYKQDTTTGMLVSAGSKFKTQPGAGPRHLAFHPAKHFAYVVNELNGTIEAMTVDSLSGKLNRFQTVPTVYGANGSEASCADIHLTPSGRFLYASNRGTVNNLAMSSVDQETGKLAPIGHQDVKGKTPRGFVIDPTGTFLLVANQETNNIVTFRIDQNTGKLIDTGLETMVSRPVCLKFLP